MRGKGLSVFSLWLLASLAGRTWAGESKPELTVTTVVKPGDDQTRFWIGLLDQTKPYVLIMDVRAVSDRKFVAGSANPKAGGRETWDTKPNSETQALFTGTVPPGQVLGEYKPVFNGLFQPVPGGKGKEDLTWKVTGVYEVSDHVYENSGALKRRQSDRHAQDQSRLRGHQE